MMKRPRRSEVNNSPNIQQMRPRVRMLTQALLCRPCLYYSGTQQGRSEGTNTLISLPSYRRACQFLCNRSPRAQEPHAAAHLLHPHRSAFRWGHGGYPGPHHSHSQDPQQEATCLSVQGQDGTHASTPSWSSSSMPLLPSFLIPTPGPALLLSHAEISCGLL